MKPSMPKTIRYSSSMTQYGMGLRDPFDERVSGVRLPNEFRTPTTTAVIRGYSSLGVTATVANAGFLFMPNPLLALIDKSKVGIYSSDTNSYGANPPFRNAITFNTLAARYSSWRLVCGGIRVRNIASTNLSSAVLSMAPLAIAAPGPGPNTLANNLVISTSQIITDLTGLSTFNANYFGGAIVTLPGFNRCTTQDLISSAVVIPFRPRDSRAYDFHVCQGGGLDSVYGGQVSGNMFHLNSTTGVPLLTGVDSSQCYTSEGWSAIALDISSLGGTSNAYIEVEYIYHIEGIPQSATFNGGICDSAPPTTYGSLASHLSDLVKANSEPLMRAATSAVGSLFNKPTDSQTFLGIQY